MSDTSRPPTIAVIRSTVIDWDGNAVVIGAGIFGSFGTPNADWWPTPSGLAETVGEFEAESVAFLVCSRIGIDNPSHEYLSRYVKNYSSIPAISLDCVLKSAGLIEQMGEKRLKLRAEKSDRRARPKDQG